MIASDYGLPARLAGESALIRDQLALVQEQTATGKVSTAYSGLGAHARTSLDLRPAIAHQAVWQSNIDQAEARLSTTQNALGAINSIAADFFSKINNLSDLGLSPTSQIAGQAQAALQQVAQLLNTKVGSLYVFAGQDTSNPPVPDTNPATLRAALLASDTSVAPFSGTLGTALPEVEIGEGQRVQVGLLANRNTLSTSAAPTTGSYMRDLMRTLASLTGLTSAADPQAVAADAHARLSSAMTAMATETGALGNTQKMLTQRKQALSDTSVAITTQLSSIEDVDLAATLTKVASLQTQLQASYQVLAGVRNLSLANYLR